MRSTRPSSRTRGAAGRRRGPAARSSRLSPPVGLAPAVRVTGLSCGDGDDALVDLHLEVAAGERVAVIGNGAPMLLRVLSGEQPPAAGTVEGDGALVFATDDPELAIAEADRIVVLGHGRILHQVHLRGEAPRDLHDSELLALNRRLAATVDSLAAA